MRISNISLKNVLGIALATTTVAVATPGVSNTIETTPINKEIVDTVEFTNKVPAKGTNAENILSNAPSPIVFLNGEKRAAKFVIDLSKNVLYHYDEEGTPIYAYLVASGKKTSPTDIGLRVVTHTETYPYKSAPAATKRHKRPWDYGPRIICLEKIDPRTGKRSPTGEFIHGNNNPNSIGKYASLGCIRMDNEVIKKLSKEVKKGDLVLIDKF